MKYKQYIVKKRFKEQVIGGYINLPYGTICDVLDDFIYYNGVKICAVTSQNASVHFWGYYPENPEAEIKRQEMAQKLFELAPKDSGDSLMNPKNAWNQYGQLLEYGFGMYFWQWADSIFDLPTDKLEYLLNCIEKGDAPLCFK